MKIRIAVDRNDNRVSVDEAVSRGDYFCEACGKPLIFRNGEVRVKHFAHKPNLTCSDSWNYGNESESYDTSEWHNEWQEFYPKENIEIIIPFQDIKHRADVLTGKTVIEFQHSSISSTHFQERTNYYLNLGYKVIWLFDFMEDYADEKIIKTDYGYEWIRPKSTFRDVTGLKDNVDIFFQLKEEGECIAKVTEINPTGFEVFEGSQLLTKDEFLAYTGLQNGACSLPSVEKVKEINDDLRAFTKKYNVKLDKQQLRAVQSIEGANLVLSVPGSGKTTVLTYRLGYMTLVKGIKPENILAITFTKNAAAEMQNRLKQYFHNDIKGDIDIRTINSLSLDIVMQKNGGINNTADDTQVRDILAGLFKKHYIQFFADTIKLYNSAICFVKSKLDQEGALKEALQDSRLEQFRTILNEYNEELRGRGIIDYNDQNNLALKYLKEDPDLLAQYQDKYKYVCVDEAQDTNQVQYEMIKLLASKNNNIFMVGDEDQSIYGFNGSYPEALLNFRDEYTNPFILRLERNYRSTNQIVDLARGFIDKNIKRNKKEIYAFRGDGKEVTKFEVSSVGEQARVLAQEIRNSKKEVAVLYRENGSAIPVINELINNGVQYTLLKNDLDFFKSSNFKKIEGVIKLTLNPKEMDALLVTRGIVYYKLYPKSVYGANRVMLEKGYDNLFDAMKEYLQKNPFKDSYIIADRAITVKNQLKEIKAKASLKEAIRDICELAIYNEVQREKVEGLLMPLIGNSSNLRDFLNTLYRIQADVDHHKEINERVRVKLATVHSAKGKEFETVYLIDAYDDVFPSMSSSQNQKLYEEERRVFYVAITRAKDELYIFRNTKKTCSFVDELFPNLSITYDVIYKELETGSLLLETKHVDAMIGDHIHEEAPAVKGYICAQNIKEKVLSEMDRCVPVKFYYVRKKNRVTFKKPVQAMIIGKDTLTVSYDENSVPIPIVHMVDNNYRSVEWYVDENMTILAGIQEDRLIMPVYEDSNNEYTDIVLYGKAIEKPLKTLLDIGDEVDFRKVLIVENNEGKRERITQGISNMYEKYHKVYGDNGLIADYDKPIWKVISKL